MKKQSIWVSTIILILALAIPAIVSSANEWPMFHHDLSLTGAVEGNAPDINTIAWTFDTLAVVESSPAIADGVLYVGDLDGYFHALDANTGVPVWLSPYDTGGQIHSSPAVADGVVFFLVDNATGDNMFALDAMTGDLVWSADIGKGLWDWSSPAVHDGSVFIGSSNGYVHSLDAGDGSSNWSTYVGGSPNSMTAVANGKVYSGTHNFNNAAPTLVALDELTGAIVWTYDYHLYHGGVVGMINCNGVVVVDGDGDGELEVYFGVYNWDGSDDQVVCLNETDGTEKWTANVGGNSTSTPAFNDGMIFIGSDDGKIYALDAATGAEEWSYQTGDQVWASPAVADGKVFVGSLDHTFYALNEADGALIWSYYTGASRLISSPAIAYGMVFVGNENGNVYAFSPITVNKVILEANDYGDEDGILEVGERWEFLLQITITNNHDTETISDLVLKDNLGGDLEFLESIPEPYSIRKTGKTQKVHLSWALDPLGPGESHTIELLVATDMNTGNGNGKNPKYPDGHQEYTSPGKHYLNSGATAKGLLQGDLEVEVCAKSNPVFVTAEEIIED